MRGNPRQQILSPSRVLLSPRFVLSPMKLTPPSDKDPHQAMGGLLVNSASPFPRKPRKRRGKCCFGLRIGLV